MYQYDKLPFLAKELNHFERFCTITVALKITDNSCKMDISEQDLFMALYDAMPIGSNDLFDVKIHEIIKEGLETPSEAVYMIIKGYREEAMDVITRPKMKAFKASIRERLRT